MEKRTFYEQINLFLESKRPRKPSACVRRPEPAYVGLMNAYVGTDLHTQLGFQKPMKDKFSTLMLRFGTNPTSYESHSKPLFSHYIKPYMTLFQNTEKILRENLKFIRNSESKREFSQNIFKSILFWLGSFLVLILEFWGLLVIFVWLWIDWLRGTVKIKLKKLLVWGIEF